jgi:MYXO-CTERM domain-containing protein
VRRGPRAVPRSAPPPPPPPGEPKLTRDAFGNFENVLESDNFAVKFGPAGGVTEAEAQRLLDALERSWAHEIDQLGHPPPERTEEHRLNVYVADTGGGVPDSYGAAGYFWFDADGWPMLVFARATLSDAEWAETTAAHELYHAVQYAIDTYDYQGRGDWWFEASATWMESEVFPEHGPSTAFLPGFALLPDLPVDFFAYPETGALQEYHQYGAGVFVRHLSARFGADLVRRSWVDAPPDGNPLEVLDDLTDGALDDAFFEMTRRNATWDYPDRAAHLAAILDWGGYNARGSRRPTGTTFGEVDDTRPPGFRPRTYGANYWQLRALYPETRVRLRVDPGPRRWEAAVSARFGEEHQHIRLDLGDGEGEALLRGFELADEVWLSVAAVDAQDRGEASWDYALSVEDAEGSAVDDTGEEPRRRACGCASAGQRAGLPLLLAALLGARRRRAQPRWSQPATSLA